MIKTPWVWIHEKLTTRVHGVGSNYVAQAPAASHLVRTFTKGWTANKLLSGGGVDADPAEIIPGTLAATCVVVASDAKAEIKTWATILQAAGYPVWVCDGTADNVEIQAAMDAIKENGESVQCLGKLFNIAASIIPLAATGSTRRGNGVRLSGEAVGVPGGGDIGTTFKWVGSAGGWIFDLGEVWGFTLENLRLNGNSKSGNGIWLYGTATQSAQRNKFDRITFHQCDIAFKLGHNVGGNHYQISINSYRNINIDECTSGIYTNSQNCHQNTFDGGMINGCTNAVYLNYCGAISVDNFEIVSCTYVLRKGQVTNLICFRELTEEGNTNFFLDDAGGAAVDAEPLTFIHCLLQSPAVYTTNSFQKIVSIGCSIYQNVQLASGINWQSYGDRITGSFTGNSGIPNKNYFLGHGEETVAGLLTDASPSPRIRVPSLTADDDPTSGLKNNDWYGAAGAYEQADSSGCSATNIRDTSKPIAFNASLCMTLVKWASDAAGTTNTGYGAITDFVDANNLTIAKFSGADFANSYYYWIKHSEWAVPVTGIYLVRLYTTYQPAEADKGFYAALYGYVAGAAPAVITTLFVPAVLAISHSPQLLDIVSLTAGNLVFSATGHIGTSGTPTLLANPIATAIQVKIWLLRQTA